MTFHQRMVSGIILLNQFTLCKENITKNTNNAYTIIRLTYLYLFTHTFLFFHK